MENWTLLPRGLAGSTAASGEQPLIWVRASRQLTDSRFRGPGRSWDELHRPRQPSVPPALGRADRMASALRSARSALIQTSSVTDEAARFLHVEAALLDRGELEDWLELLTHDYLVPVHDALRPERRRVQRQLVPLQRGPLQHDNADPAPSDPLRLGRGPSDSQPAPGDRRAGGHREIAPDELGVTSNVLLLRTRWDDAQTNGSPSWRLRTAALWTPLSLCGAGYDGPRIPPAPAHETGPEHRPQPP